MDSKKDFPKIVKPSAQNWQVPEGVPHSTHSRKAHSYSTISYEWAVYRTKGKTLSDYRPLDDFDDYTEEELAYEEQVEPNPATIRTRANVTTDPGKFMQSFDEALRFGALGRSINALLVGFRVSFTGWLSAIPFADYIYKNFIFYCVVWFGFYLQEYAYPYVILYFPTFDWITAHVFLLWPVHIDFYFIRFCFALFSVTFFVFIFFHWRFYTRRGFEFFAGVAQTVFFMSSAAFYYITGLAPFLFFILFSTILFVAYNYFYFIPRSIFSERLAPQLFLPAPERPTLLFLPTFRYKYPFFVSPGGLGARRPVKRVIKFPFYSASVRGVAKHYRFVRSVLNYNYLSRLNRPPTTRPNFYGPGASYPLTGRSFEEFFRFNPYDHQIHDFRSRFLFQSDLPEHPANPGQDFRHEDDEFFRVYRFMDFPIWTNNIAFFGSNFRSVRRSLYGDHFTRDFDTFGAGFGSRPPLWKMALVNDPYFNLYMWLKALSPATATNMSLQSSYYHYFQKNYYFFAPVSKSGIFPRLFFILGVTYGAVGNLLAFFSTREFELSSDSYLNCDRRQYYFLIAKFATTFSKLRRPSISFLRIAVRFLATFERRLDNSSAFCVFFLDAPQLRHELTHFFALFHSSALRLATKPRNSEDKVLFFYYSLLLRLLGRLLLRFTFK